MVDLMSPDPSWQPRGTAVTRARFALLTAMLIALGLSLALGVSKAVESSQDCNTRLGKLRDQIENRQFHTALRCGCDGRFDLSTGCLVPGIP
jgi:hypothetical protein